MIVAVCAWKIDRKAVMDCLEQEIDELIGERTTGCFVVTLPVVTLQGPMGSDDAVKIEPQSNHRLDMNGGMWCPFALDIALGILKDRGHVEITNLPGGLVRHFILESALREWSTRITEIQNRPQCLACGKDDRREWTEPSEHTCGRQHRV